MDSASSSGGEVKAEVETVEALMLRLLRLYIRNGLLLNLKVDGKPCPGSPEVGMLIFVIRVLEGFGKCMRSRELERLCTIFNSSVSCSLLFAPVLALEIEFQMKYFV